ncbi:MAG: hypothetical protein HY567_03700 [Candidatus Kerfeldbacteria bacterium]|nr:hypothetical protein [Candidatus Kerfeldbacteria bacterium]
MTFDLSVAWFRFATTANFSSMLFALLFLVFGLALYRRKTVDSRFGQRLWLWFFVITLVQLIAVAATFWIEWHKSSCGAACRYFFPPYSNYYFNEVIVRWISTFAFNAVVGLVGGLVFLLFARATHGRIIDQLDVDLLTVGGMVAGWPNILMFYALVFVLTMIVTIVRAIHARSGTIRMIITPILPLAAAVVAALGDTLARFFRLYEIGVTLF